MKRTSWFIHIFIGITFLACSAPTAPKVSNSSVMVDSMVSSSEYVDQQLVVKYDVVKDMYRFEDSCQIKVSLLLGAKYDDYMDFLNPDTIHTDRERAALKLINRMCGMRSMHFSDWQWMLACDSVFNEFRQTIGVDLPTKLILEELSNIVQPLSDSGVTRYMNISVYPSQLIQYYKLVDGYRNIIMNVDDVHLQVKVLEELDKWCQFMLAVCTYYSEIGCYCGKCGSGHFYITGWYYEQCCAERCEQLEIEKNIILYGSHYNLKHPVVTAKIWRNKLDSIRAFDTSDIPDFYDYGSPTPIQIADSLSNTFIAWHKARIDVMRCLGSSSAQSYDNMTSDIHSIYCECLRPEEF